jgi:hypothetical protein
MPVQVGQYFPELQDPDMESALALVHSRFSTNLSPVGSGRIPIATSPTMVKSIPCAAILTG